MDFTIPNPQSLIAEPRKVTILYKENDLSSNHPGFQGLRSTAAGVFVDKLYYKFHLES